MPNELHPYRVANTKVHLDHQVKRAGTPNFLTPVPETDDQPPETALTERIQTETPTQTPQLPSV